MPALIDAYVGELRACLGFDPALARRICAEVSDHLLESTAARTPEPADEACERAAIARFGPAATMATSFARAFIERQAVLVGRLGAVAALATWAAMKGRVLAYAWMPGDGTAAAHILPRWLVALDRGALWLALVAASTGWLAALAHPPRDDRRLAVRARRSIAIAGAAAAGLLAAVGLDLALGTAHLLALRHAAPMTFLATATLGVELAAVALLCVRLHRTKRRVSLALAVATCP
jgi:hypothetical protein